MRSLPRFSEFSASAATGCSSEPVDLWEKNIAQSCRICRALVSRAKYKCSRVLPADQKRNTGYRIAYDTSTFHRGRVFSCYFNKRERAGSNFSDCSSCGANGEISLDLTSVIDRNKRRNVNRWWLAPRVRDPVRLTDDRGSAEASTKT